MQPLRRPLALAAVAAAPVLLAACGGGEKQAPATQAPAETATEQAAGATPAGECGEVEAPRPKRVSFKKPRLKLGAGERLTAVVKTNCGSFEIALDTRRAPKTAASFAFLARKRFYDKTAFHRIVPGFVIQGGDPRGDGTGGPGYSVVEPPPRDLAYTKGVVAMAKTQAEPPGTSGSQFYVVTGADAGLDPIYALLGRVKKGLDVVARIGRLGDPATEQPTQIVAIEKVTVRRG